jgi:predicted transposase YbfD/YdcC
MLVAGGSHMENQATSIMEHFAEVSDPRIERNKLHDLHEIMVIAICAVICGADTWEDVEAFGRAKEAWLKTMLKLENGIPSHDTFGRVFARLDPEQFQASFCEWVGAISQVTEGEVVAIDGKQLRRSHDKRLGKKAIYMVSAWASANALVLGQRKVDAKSNEIRAIPKLLDLLALSGCIVTIDAMGCQTEIAQKIIQQDADYILALKENQGNLYEDTAELFAYGAETGFGHMNCDYHRTVNKGHGRIEIRQCWALSDLQDFDYFLRKLPAWEGLQTIVKLVSERRVGDQEPTTATRYFIASLPNDAAQLLNAIRSHWGIENALHWSLDVAFREDDARIRKDYSPQNFAVLRHIALNLLKQETTSKRSVKGKRLQAAWNNDYLLKVLRGF